MYLWNRGVKTGYGIQCGLTGYSGLAKKPLFDPDF